jgi:hypothetical protein
LAENIDASDVDQCTNLLRQEFFHILEITLCGNYRPISVVPKVFEKVVHEQLMKYLEHHQIIPKFQSGF